MVNLSAISGEMRALALAALTVLFIVLAFTTRSGVTMLLVLVPAVTIGGIWMAATLRGRTLGHTGLGFMALLLALAAGFVVTPAVISSIWILANGETSWWVFGSIIALVGLLCAACGVASHRVFQPCEY